MRRYILEERVDAGSTHASSDRGQVCAFSADEKRGGWFYEHWSYPTIEGDLAGAHTMSKHTNDNETARLPAKQSATDPSPVFVAKVIDPQHGPEECTIYPRDATDAERLTVWITAKGGSFVDPRAMR